MTERERLGYETAKRAFDVIAAAVAIVSCSPALMIIAVLIKATSRGPILYRGARVGRDGHLFFMYKFRTMNADAERFGTTTSLADPRVTRIGRVLRNCKLDELPQLFNVIAGDMSFVGPRPEVSEHTDAYTDEERAILTVRPGITDFSSIHFVNLTELLGTHNAHDRFVTHYRAQKNALRLRYVRERSFLTDLKIIGLTVRAVLAKAFVHRRGQ